MKLKLKPTLRDKKRYIVFEFLCEEKLDFEDVKKAMLNACLKYLGEFQTTKANPYIIKDLYKDNKGVIRVTHNMVDDAIAAFVLMTEVNKQKVIYHTLGISGILKKAKNKFLFTDKQK